MVDVENGRSRELGVSSLAAADMLELAPASAGNKLAVSVGYGRETWAGKQITIIDPDTGVSRQLTLDDVASMCPAWSPDASRIACFAGPDADVAWAKANAGTQFRVTLPNGSVETRTVASQTRIGIGGGEEAHMYVQQRKIWMLDPRSNNPPKQLTEDPQYRDEEPLWSADGSHILFARMDYEGQSSLWLIEANGGSTVRICDLQVKRKFADDDSWFGYYGYINWCKAFGWRR